MFEADERASARRWRGKVFCLVDAATAAIHKCDLLTTSATVGSAMRVDRHRSFGVVLRNSLATLAQGETSSRCSSVYSSGPR
jgi:hypothetical protein